VHRQVEEDERHAVGVFAEKIEAFDASRGERRKAGALNHPREHVAHGDLVVHEQNDRRLFVESRAVDVDALGASGIHAASGSGSDRSTSIALRDQVSRSEITAE
jgi:hypothetical protein